MGDLLVRGRADGRLQPDRAVLQVTAVARDPRSQDGALARAAETCAVVDAAVERGRQGAGALIRTAETSSIRTSEEFEHGPQGQRRRIGYVVQRDTRVECAPDGDGLTTLVSALAHDGIAIHGPDWQVATGAAGWDALRTAAVADARRRAVAYAAGVGGSVGAVRWIAEPGLRRGPDDLGGGYQPMAARAALGAPEHAGGEPLAVRIAVEPVAVSVTVEVAFDLA